MRFRMVFFQPDLQVVPHEVCTGEGKIVIVIKALPLLPHSSMLHQPGSFTGRLHDFEPVAAAFGNDTPKPKSPPDPEGMQSFIATIARMTEDGEEREGDAEPFIMENDDAVSTLNRLIEDARQILKAPK